MNKNNKATQSKKAIEKERVILSIDGATRTGYAIYKGGAIIAHGTKQFTPSKRVEQYGDWLQQTIGEWQVTEIVTEDIYREHDHTKDRAFLSLALMQGALRVITYQNGITPTFLNPLLIKSHMIPSFGRKKCTREENKQRMINRVKGYGYQLEHDNTDDEADAIGILITYLDEYNIPVVHPNRH